VTRSVTPEDAHRIVHFTEPPQAYLQAERPEVLTAYEQHKAQVDAQGAQRSAERQKQAETHQRRADRNLSQAQFYFHGTTAAPDAEPLEHILPAAKHGQGSVSRIGSGNDPSYAYASDSLAGAQHYAQIAWNSAPEGHQPIVYRVLRRGRTEPDANPYATPSDYRSRAGFRVHDVAWRADQE